MTSPTLEKAKSKLDISRRLEVKGKFQEVASGYRLDYKFNGLPKVFQRSPTMLCALLQEYGFIAGFHYERDELMVCPTDEVFTQLLDTFMSEFPQRYALMFIEEYEYRIETGGKIKQAFQLSVDQHQFSKVIN